MQPKVLAQLRWYAIRTKQKQEHRAATNLNAWGIETFAPLIAKQSRKNIRPLFPGYIFARFEVSTRYHDVSLTRGVAYVLSFGGTPTAIDEDVISTIRARTGSEGVIRVSSHLNPGDAVTIHSNTLGCLNGILEREFPDRERVRVLLTAVAYSASVEVSRYEVISKLSLPIVGATTDHALLAKRG